MTKSNSLCNCSDELLQNRGSKMIHINQKNKMMNTTIKKRYNVNLSNPYTNQRFYDSVYHPSHMFVMDFVEFVEFVEFVVRPAHSKPRAA